MTSKSIQHVLKEHTPKLMTIPGVVGTGQGRCDDKPCIKVLVSKMNDQIKEQVPDCIEGYEVRVLETGSFRAF